MSVANPGTCLLVPGHEASYRRLQPVERQLVHGKDLADDADGAHAVPLPQGGGVEPDGVTEQACEKFEPVDARAGAAPSYRPVQPEVTSFPTPPWTSNQSSGGKVIT